MATTSETDRHDACGDGAIFLYRVTAIGLNVHGVVEEVCGACCCAKATEGAKRLKVGISVIENPCGDRSGKNEDVLDPLLGAQFSDDSSEK